ncbi:hypothetical protein C8J57DRAFT_1075224, partial [Mycena rebaudengoi]
LKTCFEDMLAVAEAPGGMHPKMAKVFEAAFGPVEKIGGDIGAHKRRRTSQRTWKDSSANTMYLD